MASFRGYKRSITLDFNYDEVKEGIPNVKRQMAVLNAEFRKSNAEADVSGKSLEKLGVRYDYLGERIKIQRFEVENWEKKLKEAQDATGNNTKAVQNNTASLEIARAKLSQTQAEIDKVSKELDRQQNVIDKNSDEWIGLQNELQLISAQYAKARAEAEASGKAVDKLSASHEYLSARIKTQEKEVELYANKLKEAQGATGNNTKAVEQNRLELARAEAQLAGTKAEIDKVSRELEENKTILAKTTEEWESLGEKMDDIGKSMTMKLTVPILAAGTASFKLGADLGDALGKTEVVFKRNSDAVKEWSKTSLTSFGLAKMTALDMATSFGGMASGMNMATSRVHEMSTSLTELTMDMVTFHNATVSETETALSSIFTGATEPLKKFGIVMTEVNLQQFAFSRGMQQKVKDMTQVEKVELRYQYVMSQSKDAIGNYARESDSATAQMERFKQVVKELGTSFSEEILPVFTPILTGVNNMIEKLANMDEGTRKFIVTTGGIVLALGPVLIAITGVFKAISTVTDGMKAAKDGIKMVRDGAKLFSGLADSTQFFGFAKWAIIIGGIVVLITTLIMAINDLLGKGNSVNDMLGNIGNITASVSGAGARGTNIGARYVSGSHKDGLDFVPYDGYIAELHRGERVQRANENPYNGGNGGGDTFIMQVNMDEIDDVYKMKRVFEEFRQTKRAGVANG